MKRTAVPALVFLLVACVAAVPSWSASRPPIETRPAADGRIATAAPAVINKVVDLLNDEVQLSASGTARWESEVIDTSQFTRIGIRASGQTDSAILCTAEWQFSADDEFYASGPSTLVGGHVFGTFGRIIYQVPGVGGDPSLSARVRQFYVPSQSVLGISSNFGEVAGTRARIVCSIPTTVVIGDDSDTDPFGTLPPGSGGEQAPDGPGDLVGPTTLTDVKVLLRR